MKACLYIFLIFQFIFLHSYSQEAKDSIYNNNSLKLDIIPLYYDFFDNRVQIRAGLEFEHYLNENTSLSSYLDIGVYDKYKFIKYYNFFNENQGMYSIEQDIRISGFHLIPGYNYYFYKGKKNSNRNFFGSAMLDYGYYQKRFAYFNSKSLEEYAEKYNQHKLGLGLGLGFKNNFGSCFYFEFKTSLFAKIFHSISLPDKNEMKSLDAQWTSQNYNLWWITNLKIGYAF